MDYLTTITYYGHKKVYIDPNKEKVRVVFTMDESINMSFSIYELEKMLYHAKQRIYEYEQRSIEDGTK